MRTFWHPVYLSEDLAPGTAKPIRIMGEDFTLYRGETGTPHLIASHCPHRGAQLSVGWIEGDCVRCFYHGWKFDGDGNCVEQPAEPNPFTADVGIAGYPVEDYLGVIFAYMGEGTPPKLRQYTNFEAGDGLHVAEINYRGFNFFQDFENGMDRVHGGFVHRDQPGAFDGITDSPMVSAEEDEWGLKTFAEHPSGRSGIQSFGMPNKQHLLVTFIDMESLIWKVPVDDENTVHFTLSMIRGDQTIEDYQKAQEARQNSPQSDPFELAREVVAGRLRRDEVAPMPTGEAIWFQDDVVLLSQGVIADRDSEYLGASDTPIILLRKLWERELRALDKGRALKQWSYNADAALRR